MTDMAENRVREAPQTFQAAGELAPLVSRTGTYRAKVFKSGNSLALRLPKALGLKEGDMMILRKEHGRLVLEPEIAIERAIDLTGLYGSIPGLGRQPFDHKERGWGDERTGRG